MISDTKLGTAFLKAFKTCYSFIVPLLGVFGVICALLSCFKSAGNSRKIALICLVCAVFIIVALKGIDRYLKSRNDGYRIWQSRTVQKFNPAVTLPLLIMTVVVAFPFYILLVTAIKTPSEASNLVFTWWPKEGIDLSSFKELFSYGDAIGITMGQAVLNSFVYAFMPTIIGLLAAALSAYAFAKLRFRGRDTMYQLLIMTMMMPGCVTMTTAYIMYDWYGWTNSPVPIVVPGCFGGAATVMFLREYFMGIPDGVLEAARIDGVGKWKAFFLIMIPLGKPALLAQFILTFITRYNEFIGPLIYLNDPGEYTIQVALDFLNRSVGDKSLIASAGVFSLAPMLLLYIIFQKPIINGISMSSGLKG